MKHQKTFGITQIMLNNHPVYTFNVSIRYNNQLEEKAKHLGLQPFVTERLSKKWGHKYQMLNFTYTTMSGTDMEKMAQKLGEILKKNAQNKLNERYFWVK